MRRRASGSLVHGLEHWGSLSLRKVYFRWLWLCTMGIAMTTSVQVSARTLQLLNKLKQEEGFEISRPSDQRADLREKEDTKVDVRIQPPSAQFHGQGLGRVSRALATLST